MDESSNMTHSKWLLSLEQNIKIKINLIQQMEMQMQMDSFLLSRIFSCMRPVGCIHI